MKRVILVHGWTGNPEVNWLPWLRTEIEKMSYKVLVPEMPDTDVPVIEKWVRHLREVVGVPDAETYLIGHSVGCQAILRYLETLDSPIGGALFVAGWFNLEGLEEGEEEETARPWIDTPIDLEKVKSVLPKSTLIIGDDDPWGAFAENREKFSSLVSHEVVVHNGGHLTKKVEPIILSEFLSLVP